MDNGSPMAGFVLLAVGFAIYFLPTFVASNRKHVNGTSIFLVNLLLGWTFLGWVVALVWASSANIEKPSEKGAISPAISGDRACPFCAETIKLAAIKCKHCGADIDAVKAPRLKNGWVASVPCRDSEEQDRVRDAISALDLPAVQMIGLAIGAGPFETKDEAKQALAVLRNGPRLFSEVVYRDSVSGKYPPITD
ncbi:superinfection immunity protein [Pseudomonas chlororaphis]|uniref:superinfection immunity protein n=1 Tax=Pseudomonas chlororaphis TaxID=587753 RepID=UPI0012690985|nr:superinfection immunity protein [Pseudomonas chlororaphis]